MNTKKEKAIVVFSGGQDSTVCLIWALNRYKKISAVTFDYGQKHRHEIECAENIGEKTGIKHTVMSIDIFKDIGLSTLVEGGEGIGYKDLPRTFVPGRNIVFITIASIIAFKEKIHDIIIGVSQVDFSGYPDCREDTIVSLEHTLRTGLDYHINIITPLIDLPKADIVKLARNEGGLEMMKYTHTCYNNLIPPCGLCASCKLRAKGFKEAGIVDPLLEGTTSS